MEFRLLGPLEVLDREEANYRTAVRWAVADQQFRDAAGLGDTFRTYLEMSGRRRERDAWVEWLGQINEEEKRENYSRAIAVIFPPVDEDYGYITLEAMLSSKAVVTCDDSGGPLEFVSPRKTGLVTKPTAAGLAEALDELWQDRTLATKLGRAGRESYERLDLSWTEVVKKLLA